MPTPEGLESQAHAGVCAKSMKFPLTFAISVVALAGIRASSCHFNNTNPNENDTKFETDLPANHPQASDLGGDFPEVLSDACIENGIADPQELTPYRNFDCSDIPEFYLPDDLVSRILEYLGFRDMTRSKFVSRQFAKLAEVVLNSTFKTLNSDGRYVFQLTNIYHDYKLVCQRISSIRTDTKENQQEPGSSNQLSVLSEEKKILKAFLRKLLERRKVKNVLSAEVCSHNHQIDILSSLLLLHNLKTINIQLLQDLWANPLIELVAKYATIDGMATEVTPDHIKRFGVELFKGKVDLDATGFVLESNFFDEDRETRMQMFSLLENISGSLRALLDTEDIMDKRIMQSEISVPEFLYLDFLVKDEPSCARAMNLSEQFIVGCDSALMTNILSVHFKSPLFIATIIRFLKVGGRNIDGIIYFLSSRADSEEIYRRVYRVDDIIESLNSGTDDYTPREKIECCIMINAEDSLFLPLIKATDRIENITEIIWLCIMKKYSFEFVKVLKSKTNQPLDFLVSRARISDECYFNHRNIFECTPAEIEAYVEISIGEHGRWLDYLTDSSFISYVYHILDTYLYCEIPFGVTKRLFPMTDQNIVAKLVRYTMITGNRVLAPQNYNSEKMRKFIRSEVRENLRNDVFPHKMFLVDRNRAINLTSFQEIVLKQVLSMENGFVKLLLGQENEGVVDVSASRTRVLLECVIKFAVSHLVDFEIGDIIEPQYFKDHIFICLVSYLRTKPTLRISLEEYPEETRDESIKKSQRKHWKEWENMRQTMGLSFPSCQDTDFNERFANLGSFRRLLYDVLMTRDLARLLP